MKSRGSVFQRKTGLWVASVSLGAVEGRRRRRDAYSASKPIAWKRLHYMHQSLEVAASPAAATMTVPELMNKWLEDVIKQSLRPNSYHAYANATRHVNAFFKGHRLTDVNPIAAGRFLAYLHRKGFAQTTQRAYFKVLRAALNQAVLWEYLKWNPTDGTKRPNRYKKPEMRSLTEKEAKRLLRVARKTDRWYALYALALGTGLRFSELFGLKWSDYDKKARSLTVKRTRNHVLGKGWVIADVKTKAARRTVTLPALCIDALREHRERMKQEGNGAAVFIFVARRGGNIDAASFYRSYFKPLLRRAGIRNVRFHDFRHTHCTLLLSKKGGANPFVVAKRMGHTDPAEMTLKVYTHVAPTIQGDAARAYDRLFKRLKIKHPAR